MGRFQLISRSSSQTMDIDPGASTWNTLCPSYLDSQRNRIHIQDDTSGAVIGSPPPAGPPKILWDENFPSSKDDPDNKKATNMDTSDLSVRVQGMRLQHPQPMIICETVEDDKVDTGDKTCCDAESLAVPTVDVTNEKKRPPLSASY